MKHFQSRMHAGSEAGLKKIVHKVWRGITRDYFKNLYQLLPHHMQAIIDMVRGHTKYWVTNIYYLKQFLVI